MWSNALAVAEGGGRQPGEVDSNVVGWLGLIGNDTAIGAYRNLFWRRVAGAFASEMRSGNNHVYRSSSLY